MKLEDGWRLLYRCMNIKSDYFTAVCESSVGSLKCPYSPDGKNLQRIFCKREESDHNCCSGMSFNPSISELNLGNFSVQDSGDTFTVSVQNLFLGEGVYWCGLKNGTKTIIKLAEGNFFNGEVMKCFPVQTYHFLSSTLPYTNHFLPILLRCFNLDPILCSKVPPL